MYSSEGFLKYAKDSLNLSITSAAIEDVKGTVNLEPPLEAIEITSKLKNNCIESLIKYLEEKHKYEVTVADEHLSNLHTDFLITQESKLTSAYSVLVSGGEGSLRKLLKRLAYMLRSEKIIGHYADKIVIAIILAAPIEYGRVITYCETLFGYHKNLMLEIYEVRIDEGGSIKTFNSLFQVKI